MEKKTSLAEIETWEIIFLCDGEEKWSALSIKC